MGRAIYVFLMLLFVQTHVKLGIFADLNADDSKFSKNLCRGFYEKGNLSEGGEGHLGEITHPSNI